MPESPLHVASMSHVQDLSYAKPAYSGRIRNAPLKAVIA